jgi:putative DNA-invertase from lambdoid prophage Rac
MLNFPRVGIYLRVSTLEQSTDLQRREISTYLQARGWHASTTFEDKASGTHLGRPAFQRLMKEAAARNLDVIVCWRLDRFSRSLKDLVVTLQELTEVGVAFVSIRDQIDLTTSAGRLMLHLIGAFAEFEASLIRERVRSGLNAAKARERKLGRPRKRDDDQIILLRSQGLSYGQIQKRLGVSKGMVCRALVTPKTLSRNDAQSIENTRWPNG